MSNRIADHLSESNKEFLKAINFIPPQPEFSYANEPLELTKEVPTMTTVKTLQDIVLDEDCFNFIKAKTLGVLEDPPGGHDELWDLLRELVFSEEFNV